MNDRRWLLAILAIAALHGVFYAWYQRPDWYTQWTDQDGYRKLGAALATTGRFTRYPESPTYVPEVIRTPGYPAFVAAVYVAAGIHQLPVVIAQIGVVMLICLLVYAMGREIADSRLALAATAVTALYSPLPYFAALVVTETFATLWCTAATWLCLLARRERGWSRSIAAGVAMGVTALVRPAFALMPFLVFGAAFLVLPGRWRRWIAGTAAAIVTIAPWLAYNYVYLHRFTMSPGGGLGRAVFESSWQGKWSGRVQDQLTNIADATWDRGLLDRQVLTLAAAQHADPAPMLDYVHQWQDIRLIWTEPTDSVARINARMRADEEYMRTGFENMKRDPIGHVKRRLTRGLFTLWAAEIPLRYSDIDATAPLLIRAIWSVQVAIVALACLGVVALARNGLAAEAALLAAPAVYVTVVHLPLLTEARQSLPAYPAVLLLATCGAAPALARLRPAPRPADAAGRA
jgi:4-amino-4-deoxy-L-arabinose transferase-like glycosyltransferase